MSRESVGLLSRAIHGEHHLLPGEGGPRQRTSASAEDARTPLGVSGGEGGASVGEQLREASQVELVDQPARETTWFAFSSKTASKARCFALPSECAVAVVHLQRPQDPVNPSRLLQAAV